MEMHTAQSLCDIHGITGQRPRTRIFRNRLAALQEWIAAARAERHTIHELQRLDDRILEDIGLRRSDIPTVAKRCRQNRVKAGRKMGAF